MGILSIKENSEPNINTDGREQFEWKSEYPDSIRKEMKCEVCYILCLFLLSFLLIILNSLGIITTLLRLTGNQRYHARYIIFFTASGLLGGIVFGMKYFYRVVARGYWTQDRRYWRILSPFVSMSVAFIVGTMVSAGILTTRDNSTNMWAIAFGFFAGYFADEAVGKMYEIATLLFGKSKKD